MSSSWGRDALEDPNNTETEDETATEVAARRRRQNNRRVSFADNEITSVHVFRRDDDYDATPPSDQGKSSDKADKEDRDGEIGLFRDSQDSQEVATPRERGGQEEDEDADGLPGVFFRPVEPPSPGSCTVGSFASSIDEDNAFGPVCASLIRQGRLSESPDSNDVSHEITMDSTAFSLHFQRLLAKPDTGGDLKTPYTYPLSVEERTPSHGTNSESSMSLTRAKMRSFQSASSVLDSKSAGKDSNAMSLIGDNTRNYEYSRLSPSLEALLVSNHVPGPNPENGMSWIGNNISTLGNDASTRKPVGRSPNKEMGIISTPEVSNTITPVHIELTTAKSPHQEVPLVRPADIFSKSDDVVDANASTISNVQTPNQQLNVELGTMRSPKGSFRLNSLLNVSRKLANEQDYDRSQMKGSISSLASKRRQLFANVTTPTKPSATSPLAKLSASLFEEETIKRSTSLSTIWKNISRLKNLDPSPTSARKIETLATKLNLSSHHWSSPIKDEAAVSTLARSGHLLGDDRSGMYAPIMNPNPVLTESTRENTQSPSKKIREIIRSPGVTGLAQNTPMIPVVTESTREYTQSPSMKIRELIHSPEVTGSAQSPSKETHHVQMQNTTKSPHNKRKSKTNLEDASPLSKVARLQITPTRTVMSSEVRNDFAVGKEIIGNGRQSGYWKDDLGKFLEDTANMSFPFVDRLNLSEVHLLDDILAHVQLVRKYEVLHSEIQSQPKPAYLRKDTEKRSSSLTLLYSNIAYEKARLFLYRVKHDRSKKAGDLLKYVLQESHKLSEAYHNSLPSPRKSGPHPSTDVHCQDYTKAQKIARGTIKSLRQENDMLDEKIRSLSKSISMHCKMKGVVVDCTKVKELASDSLKKRMACRFIRQDFQAWKVCSLDTGRGLHTITLDYLGLINQRIVVKANPTPSLTISNKLDSLKIEKHYPNMTASTAFTFLFPTQTTEKYVKSRSLAQGTQITSMLLNNLLDIVEEIQLALLQINNLVDATFRAPTDEQLLLQLSYISYNKDRKLELTLDMTCLTRGVYPSEIRPHSLKAVDLEKDQTPTVTVRVKAAIKELSPGHLRIMRICECVSKAVES